MKLTELHWWAAYTSLTACGLDPNLVQVTVACFVTCEACKAYLVEHALATTHCPRCGRALVFVGGEARCPGGWRCLEASEP